MPNRYQEAIEHSNIVSKTDIDGIITFVNEEFCNLLGYTKEELIGKNHNIVRHPEVPSSNFEELWRVIKQEKQTYKSTVKNLTKDGRTVYLNTTITPIFNEKEAIEEFIAIRYDVTQEVELKKNLEQKDAQLQQLNLTLEERVKEQTQQLHELNKTLEQRVKQEIEKNEEKQKLLFWQSRMASLGQMLANIAHQWRQPLTELNLTFFNIKKAMNDKNIKSVEAYYSEGKKIIKSMSQTIDDFSNFFDPHKDVEPFLLNEAISQALEILSKMITRENINVSCEYEEIEVLGVKNELEQVIINLIQNSTDMFKLHQIQTPRIVIKTYIKKSFALIEFLDNAGGIAPQNIDKIFEPYFTTKHKSSGTGLGLFMSKLIIEKSLNGTLKVSNKDAGALFTVTIPLHI
ncbi:PAS domain-containing sensor histidine kinase [Candidatus Marinarcus aquaticus]|uniref:histidine kinase n=1 Tax=Candidatus Marinarcus aquaticus TaxID=2044504 RepID=A0A4Q0XS69_9BACT|nr:PAS domain-containing sensor histidine kinase [Candidatus Marinarcus aquaticus]RXJ60350.1 PAS domain-containing sensor histidine kinase [Candidatus Marinarcus aquaticus]